MTWVKETGTQFILNFVVRCIAFWLKTDEDGYVYVAFQILQDVTRLRLDARGSLNETRVSNVRCRLSCTSMYLVMCG